PNLAAMPRNPLVSLREVVITEKVAGNARGGVPDEIKAEAVFDLNGVGTNQKSPFEFSISNQTRAATGPTYGMTWGHRSAKDTPRRRVRSWTVSTSPADTAKARVSGRASADNRWPLGFEIEPFSFKTVRVGQKLKFKQFPVALPQTVEP
ncbi:MAG: hypothetical protein KY445_06920, partial [Armatimonadetes bacterium]|nr:hypothetical protein [Armatimonadota bacterium]